MRHKCMKICVDVIAWDFLGLGMILLAVSFSIVSRKKDDNLYVYLCLKV
jgi:hypothetical protein